MLRLRYFLEKAKRARASGTLRERAVRKLRLAVGIRLGVVARYAALAPEDRRFPLAPGFSDHRGQCTADPDAERECIDRLVRAYRAARADQPHAPPPFQLRGLWAEWIDVCYRPLTAALEADDRTRLAELMRNLCREGFARGAGGSHADYEWYSTSAFGRLYVRAIWCDYRDKLRASGYDLSRLHHPPIGNPAGVPMNGCVIPTEAFRYAYEACAIRDLLVDVPQPVVMEIGGGFGEQAFHMMEICRQAGSPVARYLDFDIPEVLFVAGYFMLQAFPGHRIRLYGEGPVHPEAGEEYDIGLFPHFAIDQVHDASVDLAFNFNSFSEMDELASRHYLQVVNRVCRGYFLHVNHDTPLVFRLPDGAASRNVEGAALVPDQGRFKRLFKHPRLHGRPEDRPFPAFAYLYERRREPAVPQGA